MEQQNLPAKSSRFAIPLLSICIVSVAIIGLVIYQKQKLTIQKVNEDSKNLASIQDQQLKTLENQLKEQKNINTKLEAAKKSLETVPSEFSYSKNDDLFTVSSKTFKVLEKFTAKELSEQSIGCETKKSEAYYDDLLSKFDGSDIGIEYDFNYIGETQEDYPWRVTIIPNKAKYASSTEFKIDFGYCDAGGDLYPHFSSDNYLLFSSACSTGFDDGSGRPHGCSEVMDFVEPTIKLN
jgi:hypothetical protein